MFSPPSRVEFLLCAYLNRIQFLEEPEVRFTEPALIINQRPVLSSVFLTHTELAAEEAASMGHAKPNSQKPKTNGPEPFFGF